MQPRPTSREETLHYTLMAQGRDDRRYVNAREAGMAFASARPEEQPKVFREYREHSTLLGEELAPVDHREPLALTMKEPDGTFKHVFLADGHPEFRAGYDQAHKHLNPNVPAVALDDVAPGVAKPAQVPPSLSQVASPLQQPESPTVAPSLQTAQEPAMTDSANSIEPGQARRPQLGGKDIGRVTFSRTKGGDGARYSVRVYGTDGKTSLADAAELRKEDIAGTFGEDIARPILAAKHRSGTLDFDGEQMVLRRAQPAAAPEQAAAPSVTRPGAATTQAATASKALEEPAIGPTADDIATAPRFELRGNGLKPKFFDNAYEAGKAFMATNRNASPQVVAHCDDPPWTVSIAETVPSGTGELAHHIRVDAPPEFLVGYQAAQAQNLAARQARAPAQTAGMPPRVQVGPDPNHYLNQNAQADRDVADRLGLTDTIEAQFAQGKTAKQVVTAMSKELEFLPTEDRSNFIVGVRATLGIPSQASAEGQQEFAAWKADYDKRMAAGPQVKPEARRPEATEPARERPAQGAADAAKDALEQRRKEIVESLRERFTVKGNAYHFKGQGERKAFEDHGTRLSTEHDTGFVVRGMLDVAEAKGWSSVKLNGTEEFRREAWLQASQRGLQTQGYTPTTQDQQRLAELQQRQPQQGRRDVDSTQARTQANTQPAQDQALRVNGKDVVRIDIAKDLSLGEQTYSVSFHGAGDQLVDQQEHITRAGLAARYGEDTASRIVEAARHTETGEVRFDRPQDKQREQILDVLKASMRAGDVAPEAQAKVLREANAHMDALQARGEPLPGVRLKDHMAPSQRPQPMPQRADQHQHQRVRH